MRIWTQKSASIQQRTSLGKSDVSWLISGRATVDAVVPVAEGPLPGGFLIAGLAKAGTTALSAALDAADAVRVLPVPSQASSTDGSNRSCRKKSL